jgi:xylan 1,4-beta-xylosidase
MYSSYTAASFARKYDLAARHGINLEGVLTWAFEFEDQPYFAGFRALATNGIDLPVLNVFRMFSRMPASRVVVESDAAAPLDRILSRGVRDRPDVAALASIDDQKLCVLLWHYHDDDLPGPSADVTLTIENAPPADPPPTLRRFQIDAEHSNAYTAWQRMGRPQRPTPAQYTELERSGRLAEIEPPKAADSGNNQLSVQFVLPRQAVSLIEFSWE